jgi:tripartite-type tricarboxylate transporter receptor subunit TctC
MHRRRLLALPLLAAPALAQEGPWPSRPITLLSGFPNGAGTDIYSRRLAEPLSRLLGQPIIVDNRTGAGGNIASDMVAKARPDGYLLLLGTGGTHAINQSLYRSLPFHVVNDFTPISHLGDVPNVLTTSLPRRPQFQNCADVLAAARARPQAVSYSSTGNGASTHLAGAQFAAAANVDLLHVPYRGQPGAQGAVLAGDVDVFFNQVGPALGAIQGGQTRALAGRQADGGDSRSRIAKTTAATTATVTISSTLGTFFGMIVIATATARPSRKYLIARVISSEPENMSILIFRCANFFGAQNGLRPALR